MKHALLFALALVTAVSAARAADATVSLDVANAYVFRGVTLNDGLVAQPALEVAADRLVIGVWGNFDLDDFGGTLEKNAFSEIDIYGIYALPIEELDVSVCYFEFAYPNGGPGDREVGVEVAADLPGSPTVGAYYGVDGAIEKIFYAEAIVSHELQPAEGLTLGVEGLLGYLSPDGGPSGFSHYTLGVSASHGALSASVTYIGQVEDEVLADAHDVELVGMLSIARDF